MSEFNPDTLGRLVRHLWVDWARKQPNPKPSWLVPYDDLSEPDKQADREIGTGVAMIVAGKLHKAAEALMSETLEGFTQEVADQYRKTVDYEQRIAALEAERDASQAHAARLAAAGAAYFHAWDEYEGPHPLTEPARSESLKRTAEARSLAVDRFLAATEATPADSLARQQRLEAVAAASGKLIDLMVEFGPGYPSAYSEQADILAGYLAALDAGEGRDE